MRIAIRAAAVLALAAHALYGQGQISLFAAPKGTGDPPTCAVPDIFYNLTSIQLKVCTATNTWTALASGGTTAFSALTGGTNSVPAHMTVGNGSVLDFTGSGLVTASGWKRGTVTQGLEVTSEQCGLVGDNSTNNYANLKNCVTGVTFAIPAQGIVIRFSPGIFRVDLTGVTPIAISKDNVKLRGAGGYGNTGLCEPGHSNGACLSSTVIRASGGGWTGNYMLTWDGTANARGFVDGATIEDMDFDGAFLAGGIIKLLSSNAFMIDHFTFHDWVGATPASAGIAILPPPTTVLNGECGLGGGGGVIQNGNVQSYPDPAVFTGASYGTNGIIIGDGTITNPDVCSIKFSNLFVQNNSVPGNHAIWNRNSDSNQFSNISAGSYQGSPGSNRIDVVTSSTATLTLPSGHNLVASGPIEGVSLRYVCTQNSFSPPPNITCTGGGTEVVGLEGTIRATRATATTLNLSGAYGLTPGAVLWVEGVHGSDIEMNSTSLGAQMMTNVITNYGVHDSTTSCGAGLLGNCDLILGWNWRETNGGNPLLSRPGPAISAIGIDGSMWNLAFRTGTMFEPIGDFPNHLINFSSAKSTSGVPDFYQVVDLTGMTASGSNGYYGIMLANKSAIGGMRNGGGQLSLLGIDPSNNLNIGAGGSFGAIQIGQVGGTTTNLFGTIRIPGLTVSQCLALDGSANVISQACSTGSTSAWSSLTAGNNTNAGTFTFQGGNVFSIAGVSTAIMNGVSGNTAKLQLTGDFSSAPNNGASALLISTVFPSSRPGSNNNTYSGIHVDIADPLTDGSEGVGVFDNGNADGIFVQAKGFDCTPGPVCPTTNPAAYNAQMNFKQGSILANCATGGALCQNNPNFGGLGLQIYDYTFVQNNALPVLISNEVGGQNPLARFRATGPGPAYIQTLSPAGQEAGIQFLNGGPVVWEIKKNTQASPNQIDLSDVVNNRVIWQSTAGATSRLEAPNSIILSSLTASANLCLDGSKVITTTGCTGGGGGSGTVNSGTAGDLAYYATSTNAVSTFPILHYNGTVLASTVPLVLPTGSGALRINDTGGTAKNVISVAGSGTGAETLFGTEQQFDFYTNAGSGPQFSVLNAGGIKPKTVTISGMPACNSTTDNAIFAVSDQSNAATAFGSAMTAGGTAHVLLHCNSAGWTVMAN